MLSGQNRRALWWQIQLSRALIPFFYFPVWAWLKFVRGYRIPHLAEVRAQYIELLNSADGPLLICANHLTVIDSLLLLWAFTPLWKCFLFPRAMPWNLPDKHNFSGNIYIRALCYVGRCLYVARRGPREEVKKVLDQVNTLLDRGHSIMIFPEGGRSRTGRVDTENFSYGVGTIVQNAPQARVLCVFMRGKNQKEFSHIPARGDEFYFSLKVIQPRAEDSGMRGAREIATQIVQALSAMEKTYFARVPLAAG